MSTPTIDLLCQHRSIRSFTSEKVSDEHIAAILKAAQAASSSNFLQCATIIRITDPILRKQIAEYSGRQPYVEQAPEFWIFCADFNRHYQIDSRVKLGKAEHLLVGCVDTALVAQNAVIAAESLGLGCVYIGGVRGQIDKVAECLQLPEFTLPLFGICIGYPNQDPEVKPRLPADLVFFENRYQPINQESLTKYDEQMAEYYQGRSSNQKASGWSDKLAEVINYDTRDFMLDYLHKQGWITK